MDARIESLLMVFSDTQIIVWTLVLKRSNLLLLLSNVVWGVTGVDPTNSCSKQVLSSGCCRYEWTKCHNQALQAMTATEGSKWKGACLRSCVLIVVVPVWQRPVFFSGEALSLALVSS